MTLTRAQTPQTLCQQFGSQTPDVTIGNPINNQNQQSVTFLSALFPNGTAFQNQKIRINGILKVDRNLSFSSCRVELERGAQIITDGSNGITSTSSSFYSCGQMWQGFYIKLGGTISITQGEIEDAEAALTLDDGAAAGLSGVTFDRNHIGIRNGSATVGVVSVNIPLFVNNVFDCTSALLPPFSNTLAPSHSGTSYAGIYLNTAVGSFNAFGATSFFRNMHFGVALENADASIVGCDFQNMIPRSGVIQSNNGIRVSGGALLAALCTFSQLNHGIYADGAELTIGLCTFTITGRSGITSINNLNTDFISIRLNTLILQNNVNGFFFNKAGIRVDRNSRSSAGDLNLTSFDVSGNTITMNGMPAGGVNTLAQRGIWVFAPLPTLDIGLISNNTFSINSAVNIRQNGIDVQAGLGDRFRVLGNNVSHTDANMLQYQFRFGIAMIMGQGINHRLQNNTCIGGTTGNPLGGTCAIHLEDMPNVTTCNNNVDQFEHGFHFYGGCNGLGYWQNTMNNHFHSLRVQNNLQNMNQGFIGTHTLTANRWLVGIVATNNSNWIGPPANQIRVPQNALPFSPTMFNPQGFGAVVMGVETACMQPPTAASEGEGELTEYDKWVAEGASGAAPASAWEEKRKLMFKLLRFPSLANSDVVVNNFYNTEYNTTLGKLAQAEYLFFSSVLQATETQNNNVTTLADQRTSLLEQLQDMDEANSNLDPGAATAPAIVAAKQALLDTWKANFGDRTTLGQQMAALRQGVIQQAQQFLTAVATGNVQEANWKTILGIRFNSALGAWPDETTLNQLRNIAAQCPEEVGNAAIAALYMLPEEEIDQLLPQEQDGLSANCSERNNKNFVEASLLRVSPNPAQDRLLAELPAAASGTWEVFDLAGRPVLTGRFEATRTFSIQTGALQSGIYLLSLRTSDGNARVHKFSISR